MKTELQLACDNLDTLYELLETRGDQVRDTIDLQIYGDALMRFHKHLLPALCCLIEKQALVVEYEQENGTIIGIQCDGVKIKGKRLHLRGKDVVSVATKATPE